VSIYAHVKDNAVVNVSVWDGAESYNPPDGETMVLLGDEVEPGMPGIGWDYDGKAFTDNRPVENLSDE
jgi:hypothetical protein